MGQKPATAAPPTSFNFEGLPEKGAPAADPSTTSNIPGSPDFNFSGLANKPAILTSNSTMDQLGRTAYASLPSIGAAGGAALAAAPFIAGAPWTAGLSATAAPTAGVFGAGAGAALGRGAQWLIDTVLDRDPLLQNPQSGPETVNEQMAMEALGHAPGAVIKPLRGALRFSGGAGAAERAATSNQYGLKLSTPEITGGGTGLSMQTTLGARGLAGRAIQEKQQASGREAAAKAVGDILDGLGPGGGPLAAGERVKIGSKLEEGLANATVEHKIANNLALKTGTATTGQLAQEGVMAGKGALAEQGKRLGALVERGPDIDIRDVKREALDVLREQIMPYLEKVPAEGPKDENFKALMRLHKAGQLIELGDEGKAALEAAALDKSTYAPLKLINKILTASDAMPFKQASELNRTLREAGKGTDLIAADKAQALGSLFQSHLRQIMGKAHPEWDAASTAYGPNAQLFESRFIQNLIDKDPEAVLASVSGRAGQTQASRPERLHQVLVALPQQFGDKDQQAAGQQAFDTIRAEWMRRNVVMNDPFGIVERMTKVDPDVWRAWFPDAKGKDVLQTVIKAGRAMESKLLTEIATADPSKVVDLVAASPSRVREARQRLTQAPYSPQTFQRVQRAWLEQTITGGDPAQLGQRIARADQDMLAAWMQTPQEKQTLDSLRRIGDALGSVQPVAKRGTFEAVEAVTVAASVLSGNPMRALQLAVGFEAVPAVISAAVYNPQLQKFLLDGTARGASATTRTAALLRAGQAWRAIQQQQQQAMMQAQAQQGGPGGVQAPRPPAPQ